MAEEKPLVFVTRELPGQALSRLREKASVEVWLGAQSPPYEEIAERASRAAALITLLTDRIDAPLLERASGLKVVSQYAVGLDNIDVAAATRLGIAVTHTPGVLTDATADLAFALLMATARHLVAGDALVRSGKWQGWQPSLLLGAPVWGATIGIIGMGRIGQAMAERARGFHMHILYWSRKRVPEEEARGAVFASLDELLSQSDFVSLHVPLNEGTRGLIGRRELGLMKPGAILINTARGQVVDEDALVEGLQRGQPAFAGLDVFNREPLPPGHPLLSLPNVVLAPHLGSATRPTRETMADMVVDAVLDVLAGRRPQHLANPAVFENRC